MDRLVLVVLIAAVPLQLLLVEYTSPKATSSWFGGRGMLRHVAAWLSPQEAVQMQLTKPSAGAEQGQEDKGQYFALSVTPRRDRDGVRFRIGQVIRHAKYGYRGVIVGWDKHARAPEAWFKRMGVARGHWGDPFYAVLVDTRDRTGTQRTYVWEGNIELAVNNWDAEAPFTIEHPEISKYFKSSPETPTQQQSAQTTTRTPRYTPKDWLQRRYPKD